MRGLRGDADISTAPDLDNANEGNDTRYFVEKRAFAVRFFFRAKGNYGSTAKKLVRCCLTERRISMQQNPMIYQLYAVRKLWRAKTDKKRQQRAKMRGKK